MTPAEITQHFYLKIPISKELGINVLEVTAQKAVVAVPLKPNLNHVNTAFGGSLYAAAALSCYALFQEISRQAGGLSDELVIQEGHIQYVAPVTKDFKIEASLPDSKDASRFIESLQRHGKARLKLQASIFCDTNLCAVFDGIYVFKNAKA